MEEDIEWTKLPTLDKCTNKAWKARVTGCEEAKKLFENLDNSKATEYNSYQGIIKNLVIDSHALVQEKGLDAALAYVSNAHVAGRICADVVAGVIAKCLNSMKQKIKEKGIELILMYIEIDKQDIVQEELLKGLENKQPKVVSGCLVCFTRALRDFGSKVITIKPLLKVIPKLLEDRDKIVREETKQLIIEIYRWIGAAIKPQMTHFQPIQVQELENEFEKIPSVKPSQQRFLRSQHHLKVQQEEEAAKAAAEEDPVSGEVSTDAEQNAPEEVDPYHLADPVEILPKIPTNFYTRIEEKKWTERRDAMLEIQPLCESIRLASGDYSELTNTLQRIVNKDTNVNLVVLATQCLMGLALGLRKHFHHYALYSIRAVIEKFKEKKPHVITVMRKAIDSFYPATTLEAILEDVQTALDNKNPNIKAEVSLFLARAFSRATPSMLPKKILKALCPHLIKNVSDMSPEVREATFEALGTLLRVVGEKAMHAYLADLDSLKMDKIKEFCNKEDTKTPEEKKVSEQSRPATAPPAVSTTKVSKEPKKVKGGGGSAKPKETKANKPTEVTEAALDEETVLIRSSEILGEETMKLLSSSDWKERKEGFDNFVKIVCEMSGPDLPSQILVRTICIKPGLKDNNFQVAKTKIELIGHIAQHAGLFSKTTASFVLPDLTNKLGDVKTGPATKETLSSIAEAISLEYVSEEVIQSVISNKNPKNLSEALNWLSQAIKEFGLKINVKAIIEHARKALQSPNAAVRSSTYALLGVIYLVMGSTLRGLFENEKGQILQQLDAEIDKVKGETLPAPIRGVKKTNEQKQDESDQDDEGANEKTALENLIDRVDISDRITEDILDNISDKNWKVRLEGLEKIEDILKKTKHIKPNIGQLADVLVPRLSDSNKLMVSSTLNICHMLVTSMGRGFKIHLRTLGVPVITCLGNSTAKIRQDALKVVNAVAEQCSLAPLVEFEVIADALKLENPLLRAELLGWLSESLNSEKRLPQEVKLCVPPLLSCLEDRNGDVRKKAQESLVPFMIHTGYDSFSKAANKLKPTSKDQLMPLLEKARADLPAKPKPEVLPKSETQPKTDAKSQRPAESSSSSKTASATTKTAKIQSKAAAKKNADEDNEPAMSITYTKEQRMKDEKRLKVLKWNFTEPRPEFVEQLKLQMEKNFSKTMMTNLFKDDFKLHIKAIDVLMKVVEDMIDETIGNLDLILKWFSLRFYDTNPSMLNRSLDYLELLFPALSDKDYCMTEAEAVSFLPHLMENLGSSRDNVRKSTRSILTSICKVYPGSRLFVFLMDALQSKNAKLRTECLEELGCMIEQFGITICQPSPNHAIKEIGQYIADKDKNVRSAALNAIVSAYNLIGENVFKYTESISSKDLTLLEERIKRSRKVKSSTETQRPSSAPARSRSQHEGQRGRGGHPAASHLQQHLECVDDDFPVSGREFSLPELIEIDVVALKEPVVVPSNLKYSGKDGSGDSSIALILAQLGSSEPQVYFQALKQVSEYVMDPSRLDIIRSQMHHIVLLINMHLKRAFSENVHMSTVVEIITRSLTCLKDLFSKIGNNKSVHMDVVKELISILLLMTVDQKINSLSNSADIVKNFNVVLGYIITKGQPTNILRALLSLLHEAIAKDAVERNDDYIVLIMKCLWKTTKLMDSKIDSLDLGPILDDCSNFLTTFPTSMWKKDDLPLRTIKTIITKICSYVGQEIYQHLQSSDPNTEIYRYIQKILRRQSSTPNSVLSEVVSQQQSVSPKTVSKINSSESDKNSTIDHIKNESNLNVALHVSDTLPQIFKLIGSKEHVKEGLIQLYEFNEKHPEINYEDHIAKSSPYFKEYVKSGLQKIAAAKHNNAICEVENKNSDLTQGAKGGQRELLSSLGLEYLNEVRSKFGLNPVDLKPADHSSVSSNTSLSDYYKERLARIQARINQKLPEGQPMKTDIPAVNDSTSEQPDEPKTDDSMADIPDVVVPTLLQSPPPSADSLSKELSSVYSAEISHLKRRLEKIKNINVN